MQLINTTSKPLKELTMHDDDEAAANDTTPLYIVDTDTESLIHAALNSMVTISDCQVDEASATALLVLADELALRFGIDRFEVVETIHTDHNGDEEIIYTPKSGSIIPEEDDAPDDEDTLH